MIQTDYCPDKFGTYLSHPESQGGGIDLSDSSVREIILAYRSYRRTLNPSFNNDHILRRVDQLEKEFSCILMPSQITDVFYANFIQWAHEKGNPHQSYCFSVRLQLFRRRKRCTFAALHHPNKDRSEAIFRSGNAVGKFLYIFAKSYPIGNNWTNHKNPYYGEETV